MPPSVPIPKGASFLSLPQIMPTGGTGRVADVSPDYSWSPLEPLPPTFPQQQRPRQYEFPLGQNLIWTPKSEGDSQTAGFWILRAFAENCDLFRLVVETVKQRLCSMKWEFRLVAAPGEKRKDLEVRQAKDPRIPQLTQFWSRPDGVNPFSKWLNMWMEDQLILDAGALYKERDLRGRIASIHVLDGSTINRRITDQGFTPPPPSTAYQQILYGQIAFNLTTNDMTYVMWNPRTFRLYGFGPVEQNMTYIGIALRRQQFVADEYTTGNMPEAFCFLPADLPIDRVKEIQGWFDSILSGDLAERRKLRFLPGYGNASESSRPNIVFPKEALLKDPLDEWLFQMFCYNLGTTPQAMLRMMNRATAQQSSETAEEEGLLPKMENIAETINSITQLDMGFADCEFSWIQKRETDALKQMQVDTGYVNAGVLSRNTVRDSLGHDEDPSPEAGMLMVTTATGLIPVDHATAIAQQGDRMDNVAEHTPDSEPDNPPPGKGKPPAKKPGQPDNSKKKVAKRVGARIDPAKLTHNSQLARARMAEHLVKIFRRQKEKAKDKASRLLKGGAAPKPHGKTAERWDAIGGGAGFAATIRKSLLRKESSDEIEQSLADAIYAEIANDWLTLPMEAQSSLEEAGASGVYDGIIQIEITNTSLISSANRVAQEYASRRAAEMIGMSRDDDGNLIPNPDAKWQISLTTRNKINEIVTDAFKDESSVEGISDAIQAALSDEAEGNGIFSEGRADMIANTEVANAQVRGNYEAWQKSGNVKSVRWLLSWDHDSEDECLLGSAMVRTGPVARTFNRSYSGLIFDIDLSSGDKFSGTPNHPVMTDSGWRALKDLREGDRLLRGDFLKRIRGVADYFDYVESRLEDKVGAFHGRAATHVTAPRDFHGDGFGSHVHTVSTNSFLDGEDSYAAAEVAMESALRKGIELSATLATCRDRFVSLYDTLKSFAGGRAFMPAREGFATGPQFVSSAIEPRGHSDWGNAVPSSDLDRRKILLEIKSGHFVRGSVLSALLSESAWAVVVRCSSHFDNVQVFNLTTECGFFVADNIITRNCDDNADVVVKFGTPFPSGDLYPPLHPHCMCILQIETVAE